MMRTGPEVCRKFQISRSTLNRYVKAGFFPKPVRLGPRLVRFRDEDIAAVEKSGLPTDRGAIISGWIHDQPDVPAENLVESLEDGEICSVAEIAEMQGMKSVAEIAAETGMRSIEEIATASAEKH